MKYSFLFVADLHVGAKLFNEPELAQDLKDTVTRIVTIGISRKVTFIAIGGDTFDNNKPNAQDVIFLQNEVNRAKRAGVEVVGISGDHDKPTNNHSWLSACGIDPVDNLRVLAGCDYSDTSNYVDDYLRNRPDKEEVEWIILHGQEPSLFPFVEEKKRLDFKDFPLFELYPNIKGILLGDIHGAQEGKIRDKGREAYIGYSGSPGVVKSDEIDTKQGLLYWNGTELSRIPFPLERQYVSIDFTGEHVDTFNPAPLVARFKDELKKPVFRVEYDYESASMLDRIKSLYEIGIVKTIQVRKAVVDGREEKITIRTELSTEDRISQVLREKVPNNLVYTLLLGALNSEKPEVELDQFKATVLDLA